MTFEEYAEWQRDLSVLAPALGAWMDSLPAETLRSWFEEVFSRIALPDAKTIDREICRGEHELEGYKRERFTHVFIRRSQEIAYNRERREEGRVRVKRPGGSCNALGDVIDKRLDPGMSDALSTILAKMEAYRKRTGQRMPDEMIERASEEALAAHGDWPGEEPWQGCRVKCPRCSDTGIVGYRDDDGRSMAGHCDCAVGESRAAAWQNNDRNRVPLGAATRAREDSHRQVAT